MSGDSTRVLAEQVHGLGTQIANLLPALNNMMRGLQAVAEIQEEVTENTEQVKSAFTRFADALNQPEGKLKTFLKTGYAFIPFFFRFKNGIELVSGTIGKLFDKVNDKTKSGPLLSLLRGVKGSYTNLQGAFTGKAKDEEGNTKTRGQALGDFTGLRPLMNFKDTVGKTMRGINRWIRGNGDDDDDDKTPFGKKILGFLGKISLVMGVFFKYLLIGMIVIFLVKTFMKSKTFETWSNLVKTILETLKEVFASSFKLIVKGIGLIASVFSGGGTFTEKLMAFGEGLLLIAGGLLIPILSSALALAGIVLSGLVALLIGNIEMALRKLGNGITAVLDKIYVKIQENGRGLFKLAIILGMLFVVVKLVMLGLSGVILSVSMILSPILLVVGILSAIYLIFKGMGIFSGGGVTGSGLSLVGEKGPELVRLPQGSRVHSNKDSRKMVSSGGSTNITVNVQGRIGASDTELRQIATKVGQMINKEVNRTTSSRGTLG